jgi:hypothetical protein
MMMLLPTAQAISCGTGGNEFKKKQEDLILLLGTGRLAWQSGFSNKKSGRIQLCLRVACHPLAQSSAAAFTFMARKIFFAQFENSQYLQFRHRVVRSTGGPHGRSERLA